MKILLTGASGFLGQNILNDFRFTKYEILKPTHSELDLTDFKKVSEYLHFFKPDIVLHAAALVGGILKHQNQHFSFLSENLKIDQNLILAAFENKITHFVQLGSSCMYPARAAKPLTEDQILKAEFELTNEGYALAKVAALKLCEYISKENSSYKYVTLIPSNLYGPFDHFHDSKSHLVAAIFNKMNEAKNKNLKEVLIWGDGKARREFLYVSDLVDALLQVIEAFELKKEVPQRMNIGLGHDFSVLEYYEKIAALFDFQGQFQFDLEKPTGVQSKLLDVARAHQFGWIPKHSIDEGLLKTFQFFKSNQGLE